MQRCFLHFRLLPTVQSIAAMAFSTSVKSIMAQTIVHAEILSLDGSRQAAPRRMA
jgi:hypothetical protein